MTTNGDTTSTPGTPGPGISAPDELAATLRQVESVRERTRAAVHPAWFPMLVFGLIGLASIPFGFIGSGLGTGLFWLVASPAGGYATSRYYRNRAMSVGVGMRGGAYIVLGLAIFVSAWVGGAVTGSAVAPMVAVAVGYVAFARLERSWPVAAVAVLLGVVAVIVASTDPVHGDVILTLVFGLSFTATGLFLRHNDRG